jgi:hypothetical protein
MTATTAESEHALNAPGTAWCEREEGMGNSDPRGTGSSGVADLERNQCDAKGCAPIRYQDLLDIQAKRGSGFVHTRRACAASVAGRRSRR